MIGTVLTKPVHEDAFRTAMSFVCNPENGAVMLEYHDRYEIARRTDETPQAEEEPAELVSIEQRLNEIEDALIELAARMPE